MSEKLINYQTEFKTIKGQYDALLEKNQNDVIKIKQKEKILKDQLQQLKKDKEQGDKANADIIKELKQQIQNERNKHLKGDLTVSLLTQEQQKIKDLEIDIRSLMDQNITLTSQNTALTHDVSTLQYTNTTLIDQNQRLKQYIHSFQQENKEKSKDKGKAMLNLETQTEFQMIKQEDIKALKDQISRAHKQLDKMTTLNIDLQRRIKEFQQDTRMLTDREKKSMALLKKRQSELSLIQAQNQKLKNQTKTKKRRTQANDSICIKCKQFEQQIHLLKQMVKSTKGMVRVKQIQVEKYRLHNNQEIKDNKSTTTKTNEKTSSLPPLKKKQNQ